MTKTPFTFAKIVSTPTLLSWSQAYTAGNVTAVISLTKNDHTENSDISLPALGKDLLNTLEAEYFTLETKTLASIKDAILATCEKNEEGVILSLLVAVLIENVLYLFIYGSGKIMMKREEKIGVLLEKTDHSPDLVSGSGFIQNNDTLLLETLGFANNITIDTLLPYLSHKRITELAEEISPLVHKQQQGDIAAIVGSYQDESPENLQPIKQEEPMQEQEEKEQTQPIEGEEEPFDEEPATIHIQRERRKVPHLKKLLLTITAVLFVIFIASIFFFMQKQKEQKMDIILQAAIVPAQKKFDESKGLMDLNRNLAREDLQSAKQMLEQAEPQLSTNSPQYKQLTSLLNQVNNALTESTNAVESNATKVDDSADAFLVILKKQSDYQAASQDDKNVYMVSQDGITSITKSSGKSTTLIKNNADWQSVGGFGAYMGNFYVLDKKGGILKYVSSGSNYGKTGYFPGNAPDLSSATSLAIDGSIWVLGTDGTISKYTKGIADTFALKGLDTPLKNPTRIFTTVDMNNVYVLDNGNSRVVVVDKNGNYVSQYASKILANAKEFDVDETNKKIFVLSSESIYEIDMK